jgi:hypothetical protein
MLMQTSEGRLVNIRKLVALGITLHGPRLILLEFGLGAPGIMAIGASFMLTCRYFIFGLYLFLTGVNYLPALVYAIVIYRKGSAKSEVEYGLAHDKHYVRKYSLQQFIIFIPLAVVIIAVIQELGHQKLFREKATTQLSRLRGQGYG